MQDATEAALGPRGRSGRRVRTRGRPLAAASDQRQRESPAEQTKHRVKDDGSSHRAHLVTPDDHRDRDDRDEEREQAQGDAEPMRRRSERAAAHEGEWTDRRLPKASERLIAAQRENREHERYPRRSGRGKCREGDRKPAAHEGSVARSARPGRGGFRGAAAEERGSGSRDLPGGLLQRAMHAQHHRANDVSEREHGLDLARVLVGRAVGPAGDARSF